MSTSAPVAVQQALAEAARAALRAPSIFNTQPWLWRVSGDHLQLWADPGRRLPATDPTGMLLTLSCGAALHHACVALAAAGHRPVVERLPDPARPDLLATVTRADGDGPDPAAVRLLAASGRRRTDRRAFADEPVGPLALRELRAAVERAGGYLHVIRRDQLPMLAIAANEAGAARRDDAAYHQELSRWTHRPPGSGDGVPPATAVRPGPRRVPVRDYAPDGRAGLAPGPGSDRGAAYAILFGPADTPAAWLRGGEALSALLLTAVDLGLATAPMTDLAELPWPRYVLRELLAGLGEPYAVVRVGLPASHDEVPEAPRRRPDEAVEEG